MEDPLVVRLRAAGCVFAEDEATELRAALGGHPAALEAATTRRVAGEPLEHVLGRVRFCGREVGVGPGVFVPRARTALLVEEAVRLLGHPGPLLLELCAGAGAVTRVLVDRVPGLRAWVGDVDPVAVGWARANLAGLPGVLDVRVSDLDAAVPPILAGRVDVLAAHVPYVPTAALGSLPVEAREHEPRLALDGGEDGLSVLRAVARCAPRWLAPGGSLLTEVGEPQVGTARAAYAAAGLVPRVVRDDERGALVLAGEAPDRSTRGRLAR